MDWDDLQEANAAIDLFLGKKDSGKSASKGRRVRGG